MNKSIFWIILAGLAILFLLSILSPGYDAGFPFSFARWCMGPGHFWGGGAWFFPLFMLIVVLFFVYMIFGRGDFRPPLQDSGRYRDESESSETVLDILKKRYASGEIDGQEFEQMKKNLQETKEL